MKRLKPILENKNLIPEYQFGFRDHHSTMDQVHTITNIVEKILEDKNVCSTVFLDVAQTFMIKLRQMLPNDFADWSHIYQMEC